MRTIVHILLMLAVLIQPLPMVRACETSCTPMPVAAKCCCCSGADAQVSCPCDESQKQAPAAPTQDLRPATDLFPAEPPTLLDLVPSPAAQTIPLPRGHLALLGGSPSMQSLLCVWRT